MDLTFIGETKSVLTVHVRLYLLYPRLSPRLLYKHNEYPSPSFLLSSIVVVVVVVVVVVTREECEYSCLA